MPLGFRTNFNTSLGLSFELEIEAVDGLTTVRDSVSIMIVKVTNAIANT